MGIKRRTFLKGAAALSTAGLTPFASRDSEAATLVNEAGVPRSIVGYGWPWTVRPGESLDFMVSTYADGPYQADLVRLICADNLTDPAIFKEKEIEAPFKGTYPGRYQHTAIGSYVDIPPNDILNTLDSFTVQVMVFPTYLPDTAQAENNATDEQHLVGRWNHQTQTGWSLYIDGVGRLAFVVGDGLNIHRIHQERPLSVQQWFSVSVSYDASVQRIRLVADIVPDSPGDTVAWPRTITESKHNKSLSIIHSPPLRFAACNDGSSNRKMLEPFGCFNGKLDRVRLLNMVASDGQIQSLAGTEIPPEIDRHVIGFWDFSQGIGSENVHDLSRNKLNGTTVNLPMRAVTGVDWNGEIREWKRKPSHYSAIYFHDDDLQDAEWEKDFSYKVPNNLPSGIYAARLRHGGSEDYIPFFVPPPKGKATASVALLIPTATYTAYTNITQFVAGRRRKTEEDSDGNKRVVEEDVFPATTANADYAQYVLKHSRELGKGIYEFHTDGTPFVHASQKHPNMTIKPGSLNWTLIADTYITDWLEKIDVNYDIITDDLLHKEGIGLLQDYQVVVTGNHPEYYSKAMLDAVKGYQHQGGRWMYLGGNGFFWVTSFHNQVPGVIEVRRDAGGRDWKVDEMFHEFEDIHGGLWANNGRAPQQLVGVGTDGFSFAASDPYERLPDSYDKRAAFIFEDIQNKTFGNYGLIGGGAAGQEVDSIKAKFGTPYGSPVHILHLARGTVSQWPSYNPGGTSAKEYRSNFPETYADLVFFETPNGGAVFSVGSMAWVGSLSHNNYQNDIARITENVLRRFMDSTPIEVPS